MVSRLILPSWNFRLIVCTEVIGLVEVPIRVNKGKGAMAQYITVDVRFESFVAFVFSAHLQLLFIGCKNRTQAQQRPLRPSGRTAHSRYHSLRGSLRIRQSAGWATYLDQRRKQFCRRDCDSTGEK